jgi:hypothetical protein
MTSKFSVEQMLLEPNAHWVEVASFQTAVEAKAFAKAHGARFKAFETALAEHWIKRTL